jgi:Wiskott-Aldrich syndrome protein
LFGLVWYPSPSSCPTATNTIWSMSSPAVVLESATHRTLHAQGFSRSSAQASLVLTDLFSRYLTLLSSTCAKYTQHAGRTKLTARDALAALDELGVGIDELTEYCASEGREMRRFALHTVRRVEDLNELKGQLAHALCTSPFLHPRH